MNELPRSVLVVEDESLVLFHLEDILLDLGVQVVGTAMRLPEAVALVNGGPFPEAAILDVNLGGQAVFPVAEALAAHDVAIVFATGYGREGLPAEWQDRPVLLKPYTSEQVRMALTQLSLRQAHATRDEGDHPASEIRLLVNG